MAALAAALMYQTTNPAIYYAIALGVYFWAYSEGEVRLLLGLPRTLIQTIEHMLTWSSIDRGRHTMVPAATESSRQSLDLAGSHTHLHTSQRCDL